MHIAPLCQSAVSHQVTSEQAHSGLADNIPKAYNVRVETSGAQPLVALAKCDGSYDMGQPFTLDDLATMPCAVQPKNYGVGAMITVLFGFFRFGLGNKDCAAL